MIGLCFGGGQIVLGIVAAALAVITLWALIWLDRRIPRDHRAKLVIKTDFSSFSATHLTALIRPQATRRSSADRPPLAILSADNSASTSCGDGRKSPDRLSTFSISQRALFRRFLRVDIRQSCLMPLPLRQAWRRTTWSSPPIAGGAAGILPPPPPQTATSPCDAIATAACRRLREAANGGKYQTG